MTEPIQLKAAAKAAALNIPFILYSLPDSQELHFMASMPDPDMCVNEDPGAGSRAVITFFNNDSPYPVAVKAQLTPADIMDLPSGMDKLHDADISPCETSTPPTAYMAGIHEEINRLKRRRNAKTVLSRVISGTSVRTFSEIIRELFATFPHAFRFVFFTQETGLWAGASPELLLSHDSADNSIATMALAGTRPRTSGPHTGWDEKNIEEHNLVTDFIVQALVNAGATPETGTTTTEIYGEVEHLLTPITATGDNAAAAAVLDIINPTPALAGTPRDAALNDIREIENHDRQCYGGYIAIHSPEGIRAYVNLRCVMLEQISEKKFTYNIFTGGGITALSDPAAEWMETELKSHRLRAILEYPSTPQVETLDDACRNYIAISKVTKQIDNEE